MNELREPVFVDRIKALMRVKGGDFVSIADAAGDVDDKQLRRIVRERQETRPSYQVVMAFARFYDVDPEWLVGRTDVLSPRTGLQITLADVENCAAMTLRRVAGSPTDDPETIARMIAIATEARVAKLTEDAAHAAAALEGALDDNQGSPTRS